MSLRKIILAQVALWVQGARSGPVIGLLMVIDGGILDEGSGLGKKRNKT